MIPRIFGLMLVRNEADILRINLLHHFSLGIEQFLIVDNGSTDGTDLALREIAKTGRVQWFSEPGPYHQAEITTDLAREAYLRGADWVIPIDADEFWHVPRGSLPEILRESSAGAFRVRVVNFVQRRGQVDRSPDALLHMTRRPPEPVGPLERIEELVEARRIGFVEILYPPKTIARASVALEIGLGNHSVRYASGPVEDTDRIVCLHAPLRSRSVLEVQADFGRRARLVGNERLWHWRRWLRLVEQEGSLEKEWLANSYDRDSLDVYGVRRPLVFDSTLSDLAAPWILQEPPPEAQPAGHPDPPPSLSRSALPSGGVRSILERMESIEGWLPVFEASTLMATTAFSLIENDPHAVVEIGSYCGRSTSVLAGVVGLVWPGGKVYAIDPHEGELTIPGDQVRRETSTWERFTRTIVGADLSEVVVPIRKRSFEVAWDSSIGLLFIDGLHDFANVSRDFHHFQRWVAPGGYVVFDDYDSSFPGVIALADAVVKSGTYRRFLQAGKMLVIEKQSSNEDPGAERGMELSLPALRERLSRQEKGITVLKEILREQTTRAEAATAERDRIIVGLHAELREKVGVRDKMIRELQAELHSKVGERDRTIRDLQRELHEKVTECNRIIDELRSRLGDNRS
jgi:predicted O-methyltransferase YrrM